MRILLASFALLVGVTRTVEGSGGLRHLLLVDNAPFNETITNTTNATLAPSDIVESAIEEGSDIPVDNGFFFPTDNDADETDSTTDAPTATPPPPANDLCVMAQGPLLISAPTLDDSAPPLAAAGTTVGATKDDAVVQSCGTQLSGPGVWFTVMGTGSIITVSTCSEATELDTKLSIYAAGSNGGCSDLICVHGNDDGTSSSGGFCEVHPYASSIQWDSVVGQTYYILVHGFATRVGPFALTVVGHNDRLEFAMPLTVGDSVTGDTSTTDISMEPVLARCGYDQSDFYFEFHEGPEDRTPRGLWYQVTGTGGRLQAQTCVAGTRLHVFESNSNNCLGGDLVTRDCSTFTWNSKAGTTYYVAVHSLYTILLPYEEYDDPWYQNPQNWNEGTIPIWSKPFELTITDASVTGASPVSRTGGGDHLFD